MSVPASPTPRELGELLCGLREASGLSLEQIQERTKISRRMLEAFEGGEYARLPDRTFSRLFLKQYLALVGAPTDPWLSAFDNAWRKFLQSSAPLPVMPPVAPSQRRLGPWVIGLTLVAVAVAALLLLGRGGSPAVDAVPVSAPAVGIDPPVASRAEAEPAEDASAARPQPAAAEPVAAAAQTASAPHYDAVAEAGDALVIQAGERPCWVELRGGGAVRSRLLEAGESWTVRVPAEGLEVTLGDAGAAVLLVGGRLLPPAGADGQVVRVRIDPPAAA
jgi:hypothetical protein